MSKSFDVYALSEFEGYQTICYMAKGHPDKQKFVDEVKAQYGAEIDINAVRHAYGKSVPVAGIKGATCLRTFNKPVRGSFPMTYVDV